MSPALHGSIALDAPYPGLRAFEAEESLLFYGREVHVAELLDRLGDNRFVAVTGTSGSGKSSLVRAGLRPALHRGYLVDATSRWRFATMRPGGRPIEALADALAGALPGESLEGIRRALKSTSGGLSQVAARAGLSAGESLLVIADQFEELFRFDVTRDQRSDAALFVSLLLDAVEQREAPVYVVVTMRSEFLGRCSEFTGLAEAFNRSQYLVPWLTRQERQEAIERPLHLFGTSASPALVQQVLNDTGEDPDQLPVLQHALLRTYRQWQRAGGTGRLEREHYEAIGGIEHALDRHGDEVVDSMDEAGRRLVERLFRSLTVAQGGVALRRPRRLQELYDVAQATDPERRRRVDDVVTTFADRGNSFVMLSASPLAPDTVVDITHESLIRRWKRLDAWVREETRSAEWYADLARDVKRNRAGQASLWQDPELSGVCRRRQDEGWNDAWANQYRGADDPTFANVESFLDESLREQEARRLAEETQRNRELEHARAMARAKRTQSIILAGLLVGVGIAGFNQYRLVRADNRNEEAAAAYKQALDQNQQAQKRLEDLTLQQEELQAKIKAQAGTPGANPDPTSAVDAAQLKRLTQEIEQQRALAKANENELQKLKKDQQLSASDRGGLLKQIENLQQQVRQVTSERDAARAAQGSPRQSAVDVGALQQQLDDERRKYTEATTEITTLQNENAALRKSSASTGATVATGDPSRVFADGVRAYDLKDWAGAVRSMTTAVVATDASLRPKGASAPPKEVRMSGTRFVPFSPLSYMAAAMFQSKQPCSLVAVVLGGARTETTPIDVRNTLAQATAECGGK
jgi:hypothetical protein